MPLRAELGTAAELKTVRFYVFYRASRCSVQTAVIPIDGCRFSHSFFTLNGQNNRRWQVTTEISSIRFGVEFDEPRTGHRNRINAMHAKRLEILHTDRADGFGR